MKLSNLLSELEGIGVEITRRKIPISDQTAYKFRVKLPCPPFKDGAMAWYHLIVDAGQEFVPEEEVEAIKLHLWHGSAALGTAAN